MFSRRKLFQMVGSGAAAAVAARALPATPVASLNWTAEELATLESFGPPIVTNRYGLVPRILAQQEINRRRSLTLADFLESQRPVMQRIRARSAERHSS